MICVVFLCKSNSVLCSMLVSVTLVHRSCRSTWCM